MKHRVETNLKNVTRRSNTVRTSVTKATELAEDMVLLARNVVESGQFLDREQLDNLKVASTILLKARELQIETKKLSLNPAVKTLVINNTARQLSAIPDEELKRLATQMLAEHGVEDK